MEMERFSLEKHWHDFISNKIAVKCKTKELVTEFLEYCHKQNIRWQSGDSLLNLTYYENKPIIYKLTVGYLSFRKPEWITNETVVDFQGFSQSTQRKNGEFKVVDKVKKPYITTRRGFGYIIDESKKYVQLIHHKRVVSAKCEPDDEFDIDFGMDLVDARYTNNLKKERELLESKYPSKDYNQIAKDILLSYIEGMDKEKKIKIMEQFRTESNMILRKLISIE